MVHLYGNSQPAQGAALYSFWGSNPIVSIAACFVLVTLGQIVLSFLISTLFFASSVVRRNATLRNLLVVTVLVSVPPSLLYYTGYIMERNPPAGLCAIQAVLMVGTDAMFVVAALALVLELLFETGLLVMPISERVRVRVLVGLPYVVFIVFALWGGILAASDTDCIQHKTNEVYCSIKYNEFGTGLNTVCATVVIVTFMLELYAFVFYRRLWRVVGSNRRYVKPPVFNLVSSLRIIAFTSMQMFYFVLLVIGLYMNKVAMYVVPTAYMSTMPLATFFIFGLSYDCLATWKSWLFFWTPPPVPPKPPSPPPSSYPPAYARKGVDPLYLEIYVRTKPLPPPPAYTAFPPARSIAPAVNDAKARGEEFPVLDIC